MLLLAAAEHDLDLGQSLLVGDADRDIEMGTNAGVPVTIRIESENPHLVTATHTLPDTTGLTALLGTLLD
jgi:D-glycero-D-manno-heptose 1,7-bisphosphate phosphatase